MCFVRYATPRLLCCWDPTRKDDLQTVVRFQSGFLERFFRFPFLQR